MYLLKLMEMTYFANRYLGKKGQGTTEYAILVGVIVVIAIIAVAAFSGVVQSLWDAIVNGFKTLQP